MESIRSRLILCVAPVGNVSEGTARGGSATALRTHFPSPRKAVPSVVGRAIRRAARHPGRTEPATGYSSLSGEVAERSRPAGPTRGILPPPMPSNAPRTARRGVPESVRIPSYRPVADARHERMSRSSSARSHSPRRENSADTSSTSCPSAPASRS